MTKYFIGIVGSLGGALAGAWLILAPFALGYQPEGADWIDATRTDFWTGIAVLAISLVGIVAYVLALRKEAERRGIIESEAVYATRTYGPPPGGYAPSGELERVLLPLATAMLKDVQEQQQKREAAGRARESDGAPDGQPRAERRV